MKILILGAGAVGSNLVLHLVPDLKGEHEITVLDFDTVEKRNIQAGTQFYTEDQIGLKKVDALQFNIYKWYNREVEILSQNILETSGEEFFSNYDLVIDCFDNHEARSFVDKHSTGPTLHIGFSDNFTFSIEWEDNYKPPTNFESGIDICEMLGASAFVSSVASVGALVAEEFILNNKQLEILGGKFTHSLIK